MKSLSQPLPKTPSGVSGEFDGNSIKLSWDAVEDAKAYLIHYGPANAVDPHDAVFMGYSETNSWTLTAENVPVMNTGDKLNFYVQTFDDFGIGANEVEKAQYLHDGEFTGSAWSEPIELTK